MNGFLWFACFARRLQCLATTYSSNALAVVPLAQSGFTAEFEMGSGGTQTLWSPGNGAGAQSANLYIDAVLSDAVWLVIVLDDQLAWFTLWVRIRAELSLMVEFPSMNRVIRTG